METTVWSWPCELVPIPVLALRAAFAECRHRTVYRHQGVHALHMYEYRGELLHAGRRHTLVPGSLAVSPMGVPTTYHLPRPGHHWCVHFLPGDAPGLRLSMPVVTQLGASAAFVRERMARIQGFLVRAAGDRAHPASTAAGAVLLELLAWLAADRGQPAVRSEGMRSYRAVEKAAALIRERPETAMNTAQLAAEVGLSPNWLARQFRLRLGITIPRYRLEQRIAQAQVLLCATALPVGEIGIRCGFPDPHHFNKLFRRLTGRAPSAARG